MNHECIPDHWDELDDEYRWDYLNLLLNHEEIRHVVRECYLSGGKNTDRFRKDELIELLIKLDGMHTRE